jgi:hypothetical protein
LLSNCNCWLQQGKVQPRILRLLTWMPPSETQQKHSSSGRV